MSIRMRPAFRSVIGQRCLHTSSSSLANESKSPAPSPKDLGFSSKNANRVRDLGKIDIPAYNDIPLDLSHAKDSRRPQRWIARPPHPDRQAGSFNSDPRRGDRRSQAPTSNASERPDRQSPRRSSPVGQQTREEVPQRRHNAKDRSDRPADGSAPSAPRPASRRAAMENLRLEDMSLPTTMPGSDRAEARSPEASREAAFGRFTKGTRTGAAAARDTSRDQPRRREAASFEGSPGPRGPPPQFDRSGGGGGSDFRGFDGARARVDGGPRRFGAGREGEGSVQRGRGAGGRKPRRSEGGGRGKSLADQARQEELNRTWVGAPLPIAPEPDTSYAALFGNKSLVNTYVPALPLSEQVVRGKALKTQLDLKQQTLRQAGSYTSALPSMPIPIPDGSRNPETIKRDTIAGWEWQIALNSKVNSVTHAKSIQAASEYIQKSLS